jgi:hypothetical protein
MTAVQPTTADKIVHQPMNADLKQRFQLDVFNLKVANSSLNFHASAIKNTLNKVWVVMVINSSH